jgi:hypothetical protein
MNNVVGDVGNRRAFGHSAGFKLINVMTQRETDYVLRGTRMCVEAKKE